MPGACQASSQELLRAALQHNKRIFTQHNKRNIIRHKRRTWIQKHMVSPSEKLAESLHVLRELQDRGIAAIQSRDLSRTHRERLSRNGFLQEVMKGWYISPDLPRARGKAPPGMPRSGIFMGLPSATAVRTGAYRPSSPVSARRQLTVPDSCWCVPPDPEQRHRAAWTSLLDVGATIPASDTS
jgi:hypothetical protein